MIQLKKRLGQHFLHDKNIINKILKHVKPEKNQHFLEIGPGNGILSKPLYNKIKSLILIEKDKKLIPILDQVFYNQKNINIYNKDILKYNFENISKKIRIIGNLPYNISTEILFKILNISEKIIDVHFMLQKEVVDRIIAKPNSKIYGRLSVMCQVYFNIEKLFEISPNVFYPKPKVQSAYIKMIPYQTRFHNNKHEKMFYDIVKTTFESRRKMIKSTLKDKMDLKILEKLNINPNQRPEKISVDDFLNISKAL
ncbi:MAG: 16S rRNA (adenine(1518)-N(6)/adenine(1519)-N(6))-dimethyltransferase [Gammaproteobacteria bacterium]|nr:16S rRNA (adenine(1518)-N(6)/adenine(1519)-N(6))-dimethyltransferase [Gammaproteobacteria bacterium]|tara:strand:- start:49 stop:810 length:762 start_codon:yes stop_codon:yes gene_type:complete